MKTGCVFLVFYLLFQFSQSAEIVAHPISINTTLNASVDFVCEATGDFLNFLVDGLSAIREEISARGFVDDSFGIGGGVIRGVLTATAYAINNNTNVTCVATTLPSSSVTSDTVFLTIQGILASVIDLDYTFINGSSALLTWTAPYTLDNVPITGYYIVNGLVNITTNNKSIILSATNPDPCILNDVSVSPINGVGIGSSNNISFYYETVPLVTPPVSVVPVIDGQLISLNISINVSELCKGEYPNSITVNILNTNDTLINNTSIPTQVNDQLMIVTGSTTVTLSDTINTFTVNVSLSNNGGTFNNVTSFTFGFLGPVTNIDSSIDNCSTIDITWTAPTVDDRVSILFYILRIYDDINGCLVNTVAVYGTSYQFMDNDLFRHRYTYVITGVNELGEGISNNDTFSYQRVPRSVTEGASDILEITFNETSADVSYDIPVTLECTGEAPENVTVTMQCNETGLLLFTIDPVEFRCLVESAMPVNITRLVPNMPLNEQCNISIVFSNGVGSSEPFILTFDTIPTPPSFVPSPSPTITRTATSTSTPSSPTTTSPATIGLSTLEIIGISVGCVIVVLTGITTCIIVVVVKKKRRSTDQFNVPELENFSQDEGQGQQHQPSGNSGRKERRCWFC